MGDSYEYCAVSGLPIHDGDEVVSFLVTRTDFENLNDGPFRHWKCASIPFHGIITDSYTATNVIEKQIKKNTNPVINFFTDLADTTEVDHYAFRNLRFRGYHLPNFLSTRVCSIRKEIWDLLVNDEDTRKDSGWYKRSEEAITKLNEAFLESNHEKSSDLAYKIGWENFACYMHTDVYFYLRDKITLDKHPLSPQFISGLEELNKLFHSLQAYNKVIHPNEYCSQDDVCNFYGDEFRIKLAKKLTQIYKKYHREMNQ